MKYRVDFVFKYRIFKKIVLVAQNGKTKMASINDGEQYQTIYSKITLKLCNLKSVLNIFK